MVVVSTEIFLADEQVVVSIQLPEFAVDDVEMFVREKVRDLVYVVFILQTMDCLINRQNMSSFDRINCQQQQPVCVIQIQTFSHFHTSNCTAAYCDFVNFTQEFEPEVGSV